MDSLDHSDLDRLRGPVRVNLKTGAASRTGGGPEDRLTSISNAVGTSWADVLLGDATDGCEIT